MSTVGNTVSTPGDIVSIHRGYHFPTPENDQGDASDSISQWNQICSRSFWSIEHEGGHDFHSKWSFLVHKHERTAYHIHTNVT